jgi:hypothetical protein
MAGDVSRLLSGVQWFSIVSIAVADQSSESAVFGARTMVEAIHHRYRCRIAWRDLPAVFVPRRTV